VWILSKEEGEKMDKIEITENREQQLFRHAVILDLHPIQSRLALLLINEGYDLGAALTQAMHYHPGENKKLEDPRE
jgi:hypothetical protein